MARNVCFSALWVLAFVSCHRRGRGEDGQGNGPKLEVIITPLGSPSEAEIGSEVELKCTATGFPQDLLADKFIYWEKLTFNGPKPITSMQSQTPDPPDSEKYEISYESSVGEDDVIDIYHLRILDITYDDDAEYNCYTVHETRKIENRLKLHVIGPPMIKLFETFISVQEGMDVSISGHFLAKPRLNSTSWFFNEVNAIQSSSKYGPWIKDIQPHHAQGKVGFGQFGLLIKSATASDSGNYSIWVMNSYGHAYGTVEIKVTQALHWVEGSDKAIKRIFPSSNTWTSESNTEFKIICSASGFIEPPTMKWLFFGTTGTTLEFEAEEEVIHNSVTVKTYLTQNRTGCFYTLYIDSLHFDNNGVYVCKLNGSNDMLDYMNLTVIGTPVVQSTGFVINGTLGQTVTLTCHIWANPMPFITAWYLDNNILTSTARFTTTIKQLNKIQQDAILRISSLTEKDFGVYDCRVFNTRGYAMAIHIIQDVDECSYSDPCNQGCTNTLGSFTCQCNEGYGFVNGSKTYCEDIDECNIAGKQVCGQICTNTNGSFLCSCHAGFTLDPVNGYACTNNNQENNSGENEGLEEEEEEDEISEETLYAIIGVCAGGVLVMAFLILMAMYYRRRKLKEDDRSDYKAVYSINTAYDSSIEKDSSNLNSYLSTIKNASLKDEFPRQRLQLGIDLGQGRFGKVMMARALNISGTANWEMIAVKTCRDSASDSEKEDLIQELEIMRNIPRHKNIVAYLGCCTKQDPVYILMEYVKGGNLQVYLRKCRPSQQATTSEEIIPPCAKDLKSISLQIARGMSHLHTSGIIHRDLSARNILITSDLSCKICDFGLSRDVEGCDVYERSSKGPLPIRWMAPESLTDQWFTKKTDVWSYGVLVWEIVTLGATPYPGMAAREVIRDVTMGKWLQKPLHCKQELYLLMTSCWNFEAANRPTFKEIVCDMEALLSQEAEYIEFNTYQEDKYNVLDYNSDERV